MRVRKNPKDQPMLQVAPAAAHVARAAAADGPTMDSMMTKGIMVMMKPMMPTIPARSGLLTAPPTIARMAKRSGRIPKMLN